MDLSKAFLIHDSIFPCVDNIFKYWLMKGYYYTSKTIHLCWNQFRKHKNQSVELGGLKVILNSSKCAWRQSYGLNVDNSPLFHSQQTSNQFTVQTEGISNMQIIANIRCDVNSLIKFTFSSLAQSTQTVLGWFNPGRTIVQSICVNSSSCSSRYHCIMLRDPLKTSRLGLKGERLNRSGKVQLQVQVMHYEMCLFSNLGYEVFASGKDVQYILARDLSGGGVRRCLMDIWVTGTHQWHRRWEKSWRNAVDH